jgi:cell wall-associated NlpC family hydrolase
MEAKQLLTSATELNAVKDQRQRTESGVQQLTSQYASQKSSITQLLDKQKAMLDSLTSAQQAQVTANSVGGSTTSGTVTTSPVTYTGPTSSQAGQAVAFAYAQLGKPYVWGATGPDSYDCSGLMFAAWESAGVSMPRDTYGEWASLPHIPLANLQPGDLILYNGESHVAMYVGNGYIIDAPHTGAVVEKLPESTSWYASGEDGAVRP